MATSLSPDKDYKELEQIFSDGEPDQQQVSLQWSECLTHTTARAAFVKNVAKLESAKLWITRDVERIDLAIAAAATLVEERSRKQSVLTKVMQLDEKRAQFFKGVTQEEATTLYEAFEDAGLNEVSSRPVWVVKPSENKHPKISVEAEDPNGRVNVGGSRVVEELEGRIRDLQAELAQYHKSQV